MIGKEPSVGALVWRLSNRWRATVDRALQPLGLTHAQYSALASLRGLSRGGDRPSQRRLADWTGLEPMYISKLVTSLEQAGYLRRERDPRDSRAVRLSLTDHGTEVVDRAIARVQDLLEELTAPLGGVSDDRTRELSRSLRVLLGEGETP